MFESNTPNRLGSAPSVSGNHQPCSERTVSGLSDALKRTRCLHLPRMFSTQIQSPSHTPILAAVSGCRSVSGSGCDSRRRATWRSSEWKYSHVRAPVVRTYGYSANSSGVEIGLSGGSS